jgi:hypothetical protein
MNEIANLESKQAELLVLTQVRKNLGNNAALQKIKFDVHVEVRRLSDSDGQKIVRSFKAIGRESKMHVKDCSVPAYQLRAAHELAVQESLGKLNLPAQDQQSSFDRLMRKNYVYPNGGYTRVEFKHPVTGKVYVGEAFCHILDQFNRKKSHCRAWGRIYRQLLEDSSMGFKIGKKIVDMLAK